MKRLLGIEALEKRIADLEESQTTAETGEKKVVLSDNVLNEWINGEEDKD